MTTQRALLLAVLIPFAVYTDIALFNIGSLTELTAAFTGDLMVIQVSIDLVIAIGLACLWVWKDAKSKGANPVPYIALMMTLGSIGLMVYLFVHVAKRAEVPVKNTALTSAA